MFCNVFINMLRVASLSKNRKDTEKARTLLVLPRDCCLTDYLLKLDILQTFDSWFVAMMLVSSILIDEFIN